MKKTERGRSGVCGEVSGEAIRVWTERFFRRIIELVIPSWNIAMKIAQIAPLIESVPPRLYGGTERVVSYLSEALVELGHEVTLFARSPISRAISSPTSRSGWAPHYSHSADELT